MTEADRTAPRCLTCAKLTFHGTHYSCPQNRKFDVKKLPQHFAEKCTMYTYGEPITGRFRVFSCDHFDIEVGESYRSIHLMAKKGYVLKIDPQSNPQKITAYVLEG